MSCGVRRRRSSDPVLLWLWRRPAATALIRPLAWEPPHAAGAAQEMAKKTKKQNKKKAIVLKIKNKYQLPDFNAIFIFSLTKIQSECYICI